MNKQGYKLIKAFRCFLILLGFLSSSFLFGNSPNNLPSENFSFSPLDFEKNEKDNDPDDGWLIDFVEGTPKNNNDISPLIIDLSVGSGSCAFAQMVVPTDPLMQRKICVKKTQSS